MTTTQDRSPTPNTARSNQDRPPRKRWWRRGLRWIEHILAACSVLLLLLLISPVPHWMHAALDRQTALSPSKYIICLGGAPARVIESARLLREGYGEKLIVSNNEGGAPMMEFLAMDWGVPPDAILVDPHSHRTMDHPGSIQRECGVDPSRDTCIIVTSYTHMARAKACFEKAGYKHIIMREPRWERQFRPPRGIKTNYWILPEVLYEYGALAEYWVRGAI